MKAIRFCLAVCACLSASLISSAVLAEDYVGTLPGSFAVSPSGAAIYTIPIEVPPGINGMQPNLAFVYNSQAGNGEMGVGWGLSGLSAITRCAQNLEMDDEIRGVKMDLNDKFCLSGQRLILTSGNYGGQDSEYRTTNDSVVKVVAKSQLGSGPESFEVYHKSGKVSYYGSELDSRYYQNKTGNVNTDSVYSWKIKKIEDQFSNNITYNYFNYSYLGIHLLTEIEYSDYSLTFDWGSVLRDDVISGYLAADTKYLIQNRLENVSVIISENTTSSYIPVYEYRNGRTIVTSFKLCHQSNCVEDSSFNWRGEGLALLDLDKQLNGYGIDTGWTVEKNPRHLADVNGDGLSDMVAFGNDGVFVHLATGDGSFESSNTFMSGYGWNGWWRTETPRHLADINGDGMSDIVAFGGSGVYVALAIGDGHFQDIGKKLDGLGIDTGWTVEKNPRHLADINGDGLSDIVAFGNDGVFVHLATGDGGFESTSTYMPGYGWNGWWRTETPRKLVDINGDGMSDIVAFGGSGVYVALAIGGGHFQDIGKKLDGLGIDTGWTVEKNPRHLADINGDGLPDIVAFGNDGVFVHLATGDGGFESTSTYMPGYGWNGWWRTDNPRYLADINGDGMSDIVGFGDAGIYIALATGQGNFQDIEKQLNGYGYSSWWRSEQPRHLADITGDGLPDIIGFGGSGLYVATNQTTRNDIADIATGRIGSFFNITSEFLSTSTSYIKGTLTNDLNLVNYQGPMPVVTSVVTGNGIGGINTTSYTYEGMKIHLKGLGSLGFNKIDITDSITGFTSSTTYSQDWVNRTVGMIAEKSIWDRNGRVISYTKNELANGYDSYTGTYENMYLPYIKKSIRSKWDINASNSFLQTTLIENDLTFQGSSTYMSVDKSYSCKLSNDLTYGGYDSENQRNTRSISSIPDCSTLSNYVRRKTRDMTYFADSKVSNQPLLVERETIKHEVFDRNSSLLQQTRTKEYDYTAQGQLWKEIVQPDDNALKLTTEYGYKTTNGLVETITVSGAGITTNQTKMVYDAQNRLVQKIDGNTVQDISHYYGYQNGNFPWLVTNYRSPNTPTGIWDTTTVYDSFGHQKSMSRRGGSTISTQRMWCTTAGSACDTSSHESYVIIGTSTTKSESSKIFYDAFDREVRRQTTMYSSTGNQIAEKITKYQSSGAVDKVSNSYIVGVDAVAYTTFVYDDKGRQVSVERPHTSGFATTTTDFQGLTTTVTGPAPKYLTKTIVLNAIAQKMTSEDENNNVIEYGYDPFGNLNWMDDKNGNKTTIVYNKRGQKTDLYDPDKGHVEYTYDVAGRSKTQKVAGLETTMTYDNLGRLIRRVSPEGTSDWVFDVAANGIGKLESRTNNDGYTESYTYDSYGRPHKTTTSISEIVSGSTQINTYQDEKLYDTVGRLDTYTYPGSTFTLKNTYDSSTGILKEIRNNSSQTKYWQATHIDARGNIEGFSMADGIIKSTRHRDDRTGFLDSVISTVGFDKTQYFDYGYDELGNVDTIHDYFVNTTTETFIYDGLNRLTQSLTTKTDNSSVAIDIVYEANDLGNIETKTHTVRNAQGTITNTIGMNYTYDGLSCGNSNPGPHAVTGISGNSDRNGAYCYDQRGNMTSGGLRDNIVYNSYDKPTYIQTTSGNSTQLFYGPDRARYMRIDEKSGDTTTTVTVGPMQKVIDNSGTTKKYSMGQFGVVNDNSGSLETIYFLRDHLGSLTTSLSSDGSQVQQHSFDAWGQRREANGNIMADPLNYEPVWNIGNRGFTGHEHLDGTGLIHMNGRVYDPMLARFLSTDPYVQSPLNLQSLNRYSYVMNNPLNAVDPDGFWSISFGRGFSISGSNPGIGRWIDREIFRPILQPLGDELKRLCGSSCEVGVSTDGNGNTTATVGDGRGNVATIPITQEDEEEEEFNVPEPGEVSQHGAIIGREGHDSGGFSQGSLTSSNRERVEEALAAIRQEYPDLGTDAVLNTNLLYTSYISSGNIFSGYNNIVGGTTRLGNDGTIYIGVSLSYMYGDVSDYELQSVMFHELIHADQLQHLGISSSELFNNYQGAEGIATDIETIWRENQEFYDKPKPDLCTLPWRSC